MSFVSSPVDKVGSASVRSTRAKSVRNHASHGPFLDRQSGAERTGQCGTTLGIVDAIQIPLTSVPCIAGSDAPLGNQEEG